MEKIPADNKKQLKKLNAELKILQEKLIEANKLEGKDVYIDVKIKKNQARSEKQKQKGLKDKVFGKFYLQIDVTAKASEVFVPISIASGKKTAGLMYQIEGTGEGSLVTADTKVRGEGILQVKVGTLLYAKLPAGKTASFEVGVKIRGKSGKSYKIVFTRLNYKLQLTNVRYEQYLKELHSDSVTLP